MDQKEKALEEEPEMDPEVAAMMGFGGFGSSKKWSLIIMPSYHWWYSQRHSDLQGGNVILIRSVLHEDDFQGHLELVADLCGVLSSLFSLNGS